MCVDVSLFSEVALQDARGRPVDIRTVARPLHQGGAATLRGRSVCAHHPAHGNPQLRELPFSLVCHRLLFVFYKFIFSAVFLLVLCLHF